MPKKEEYAKRQQSQTLDTLLIAVEKSEHVYTVQEVVSVIYGLLTVYYQQNWFVRLLTRNYKIGLEAALDVFVRNALFEYQRTNSEIADDIFKGFE